MEDTLKVTNVFSDPTRFNIYQYIVKKKEKLSVLNIAEAFDIHPNVARLHLTKLEEINVIRSSYLRTGKGGRPSRLYELSDKVVELNFPQRDYKTLASIALESFAELGELGKDALYRTGKKYGEEMMQTFIKNKNKDEMHIEDKLAILKEAGTISGLYPEFTYNEAKNEVSLHIQNCPFQEVAVSNHKMVCSMHHAFIKGMFESLFTNIELIEENNLFNGCDNCSYAAKLSIV